MGPPRARDVLGDGSFRFLSLAYFTASMSGSLLRDSALWWVERLTGRGVLVGVTAACFGLAGVLLALWGGRLADRIDNRRLVVRANVVASVPPLVLLGASLGGVIAVWMVMLCLFFAGGTTSIQGPARRQLRRALVASEALPRAVGVTYAVSTAGQFAGSALAGALIASVGVRSCLLGGAMCCAVAVLALRAIPQRRLHATGPQTRSASALRDALRDVRSTRSLWIALSCLAPTATIMLALPALVTLLAAQTWSGDPRSYAWLRSVSAAGLVIGGLITGRRRRKRVTPGFLVVAGLGMGTSGLLLGATHALMWQVAVIAALTITWGAFQAGIEALLQAEANNAIAGTVMGLYAAVIGAAGLVGNAALGGLADVLTAQGVLVLSGGVLLPASVGALLALTYRRART